MAVGQLDRPSDLAADEYDWVACMSSPACGWAQHSGFPAKGPLRAVPGGSPTWRLGTPSTSTCELSCASSVVGLWRVRGVSPTCTRLRSLSPGRRSLWLNIGGKEAAALSTFHVSVPLPEVNGGITGSGRGCSPALSRVPGPWLSPAFLCFLMGLLVWLYTQDWVVWWPVLAGWVSPG